MNFNINLFITPAIALGLVLWGYLYFRKIVNSRTTFNKYLGVIGALSFFLNWVWEVAQGPLYSSFEFDLLHISFCGLASIADMLMVYVLWFGFGSIYKNVYWVNNLTGKRIFWLMLTGGVGAILAEIRHTAVGNWSYAEAMPLLPWVEVGLFPAVQFSFIPLIIFYLTKKIL